MARQDKRAAQVFEFEMVVAAPTKCGCCSTKGKKDHEKYGK
jgi:hypothetical protein